MEVKKDVYKDILENISNIYSHEKKINEKIIEIQRTNANLLRNQRDLAKIVISIDKQQQRIINQMNFIANRLDKLDKDTDTMKEEQLKMNDKLLQNSAAEQQNATIFRNIQTEIDLGNRANFDKMEQIRETVAEITKHFHKFNATLEQVNCLAVDFLGDIRKELGVSKKASIIIREASPKLAKPIDSNGLKSIHIPKAASVNEQMKGVILKEIDSRTNQAASKERIAEKPKEAKRIPSKQMISSATEGQVKSKSSKENIKEVTKDAAKDAVKKKEPAGEDKVQKGLDQPKESQKKEGESNERKSLVKDLHPEEEKKAANALVSSVKSSDDQPTKESRPVKVATADLPKSKIESNESNNNANKSKLTNELKPSTESKPSNEPKSPNGLKAASKEEKKDAKGKKESASANKQMAMLIVADHSDSTTKVVVTSLRDSLLDVTKALERKDGASKDTVPAAKEPSNLNLPVIPNESLPKQVNLSSLAAGPVCDLPAKEVKSDAKSETKNSDTAKEQSKDTKKN